MLVLIANLVPRLFYILLFFVPLALFPTSSELFEFNKMVTVYALTVLIIFSWLVRMLVQRKIIFRRTIFDIPILLFLLSQFLSVVASIDFRTSLLGYYSRFHGGFLSYLAYALLFWAWVSNMDKDKTLKAIRAFLISAVLVSVYGVLEHLGIDKDIWIQDVQQRVFSTFGQPNWLAAYLAALLPLTWALILSSKYEIVSPKRRWLIPLISSLYFLTLLYTKSRSGLLGFLVSSLVFWLPILFLYIKKAAISKKEFVKKFFLLNILFLFLFLLTPTPYFKGLGYYFLKPKQAQEVKVSGPVLEVGGTESGTIRRIVWKGALDIWKHYPILGTGVETFAYSYYQFRPVEHNLVSEWDFLYNKAHNEYLNFAANTGTLGLTAYLFLIATIIGYFVKKIRTSFLHLAFLAGIVSILVTNFFGFSVVGVSLQLFLYPAMAVSLAIPEKKRLTSPKNLATLQKYGVVFLSLVALYFLYSIARYWLADLNYSYGKSLNDTSDLTSARARLVNAIKLSPKEAVFWDELSQTDTELAVALFEANEKDKADEFVKASLGETANATFLSPRNINLKRNQASVFIKLSAIDSAYLEKARDALLEALTYAPTEAKLFYNLGLTYLRLGDYDNAVKTLEKTINMKPNYRDARLALALSLIDLGEKTRAKEELNYILEKIAPDDAISRQTLEDIK